MKRLTALLATLVLLLSLAYAESATAALQELYAQAELLMVQGDYTGAAAKFEALGLYSDASQMAMYCKAVAAAEMLGLHSAAVAAFNDLGDFKDSKQMAKYYEGRQYEAYGMIDVATASDSRLEEAIKLCREAEQVYGGLFFFKDSLTRMTACSEKIKEIKNEQSQRATDEKEASYQKALTLEQNGDYAEAIKLYKSISGYKDSSERIVACEIAILDCKYDAAVALMNAGKYSEAITVFTAIKEYRDSAEQIKACEKVIQDRKYDAAVALMNAGKYSEAIIAFTAIKEHRDSAEQITACETAILDGKYDAAVALMNSGKYYEAYNALLALKGREEFSKQAASIYTRALADKYSTAKVGDIITFGSYPRKYSNSDSKSPIEWIVLAKEHNRLLVLSRNGLDYIPYNNTYENVTWVTCSLRKWLNNDFIKAAFSSDEQTMILTVTVPAEKSSISKTNPGQSTQDKVFLLSCSEAIHYGVTDADCILTNYAYYKQSDASRSHSTSWWLRNPGESQNEAMSSYAINQNYSSSHNSLPVNVMKAIRPAFWIDLSIKETPLNSNASTATSKLTSDETPNTTPTPETTYKPLKQGNKGDDVLAMKKRLQELGYFSAGATFSNQYNSTTTERVKLFQKANGLQQTGVADETTLALLFSDKAKKNPY